MKSGFTFATVAAMAAFAVGLLGSGVASAGNPCVKGCRATKSAGMKECRDENPCRSDYSDCKQTCRQQHPAGVDRTECFEGCKQDRKECKEDLESCKDGCTITFHECEAHCVELGFPSN
jgi:hypothetical protein